MLMGPVMHATHLLSSILPLLVEQLPPADPVLLRARLLPLELLHRPWETPSYVRSRARVKSRATARSRTDTAQLRSQARRLKRPLKLVSISVIISNAILPAVWGRFPCGIDEFFFGRDDAP